MTVASSYPDRMTHKLSLDPATTALPVMDLQITRNRHDVGCRHRGPWMMARRRSFVGPVLVVVALIDCGGPGTTDVVVDGAVSWPDSASASSSGSSSAGSGSSSMGSGSGSAGVGSGSASSSDAGGVDAGGGDVTIVGADAGTAAADGGSLGTDGGAPSAPDLDRLLALTKICTQANSAPGSHVYPDPGSAVPNDYICTLKGAVFFNADMDIDCDGRMSTHCPGTGADKDCCYQPMTSFTNLQGQPLSAEATPYVVIPLDFIYPGLDQTNGGNVVAVIYNHQLEFAVFGDQGPINLIGEASYATAKNLGINASPARGGVGSGVTYIVFVGAGTQPHDIENQAETRQLGTQLTAKLLANN